MSIAISLNAALNGAYMKDIDEFGPKSSIKNPEAKDVHRESKKPLGLESEPNWKKTGTPSETFGTGQYSRTLNFANVDIREIGGQIDHKSKYYGLKVDEQNILRNQPAQSSMPVYLNGPMPKGYHV